MQSFTDYLKTIDPASRELIEHYYLLIRRMVPDAKDGTENGRPALMYKMKPLVSFSAIVGVVGMHTFSRELAEIIKHRYPDFDISEDVIVFKANKPLADETIKEIIGLRIIQIG